MNDARDDVVESSNMLVQPEGIRNTMRREDRTHRFISVVKLFMLL